LAGHILHVDFVELTGEELARGPEVTQLQDKPDSVGVRSQLGERRLQVFGDVEVVFSLDTGESRRRLEGVPLRLGEDLDGGMGNLAARVGRWSSTARWD
jgi:hypothetical protein